MHRALVPLAYRTILLVPAVSVFIMLGVAWQMCGRSVEICAGSLLLPLFFGIVYSCFYDLGEHGPETILAALISVMMMVPAIGFTHADVNPRCPDTRDQVHGGNLRRFPR